MLEITMASLTQAGLIAVSSCLLVLSSGTGAFATTMIAVLQKTATGTSIVLGADGVQSLISIGGKIIGERTECKITRVVPYYYVIAGLVFSPDRSYDAYREASRILSESGSFTEKTKRLEKAILSEMNSTDSWPVGVVRLVEIFIVNSAELPQYYFGTIIQDDAGHWAIAPPPAPQSGIRFGLTEGYNERVVVGGTRDHIRKEDANHPGSPAEIVKRLIEIEAKEHPHQVGGPISIVEFDGKGGVNWIERGACRP